jgi:hypothetical protein
MIGYEATYEVKSIRKTGGSVEITAHSLDKDERLVFSFGETDYNSLGSPRVGETLDLLISRPTPINEPVPRYNDFVRERRRLDKEEEGRKKLRGRPAEPAVVYAVKNLSTGKVTKVGFPNPEDADRYLRGLGVPGKHYLWEKAK